MDKYEELCNIGNGQFGLVKKIKRISDGRIMVWKEINYGAMSKQQKNQLINEVNILKDLSHENIVKYYGHFVNKKSEKVYIIMQYCPGGDLGSVLSDISKKGEYLDEDLIWKLFFQITTAMHYCHKKKILHRDLKPANIFIDSSRSNIKLGDFGLSRELGEHSQYAQTYVGTPYYMSPEQIEGIKYNEKCDVWSLGCIIYQLASLKRPFKGSSILQLAQKIKKGQCQALPSRYSYNLRDIIGKMLSVNINNRPSTSQILSIPLMKIRLQERQIKLRYQQLKKRQEYLKSKQQEYRQKLAKLEKVKLNESQSFHRGMPGISINESKTYKSQRILHQRE